MFIWNNCGGNPNKSIIIRFDMLQIPLTNHRMTPLLLLITVFASCSSTTSGANFHIAMPNCDDRCGNISIPFPFGTTPGCYLSPSFWLTCNQSSLDRPKLFWQNTSIELTDVSLSGQIRILLETAHDCYDPLGKRTWYSDASMELPALFTANNTANKLTTVGCDTVVVTSGRRLYKMNYTTGCIAMCDIEEDMIRGSCNGLGCCQMSIPKDVRSINIKLNSYRNYTDFRASSKLSRCSHAFLAEETAFEFSVESTASLMNVTHLPMVADWAIVNGTCGGEAVMNSSTYACKSQYSMCYNPDNGLGYRCICNNGYEGNPYLDDGCQDIDECQDPSLNSCRFRCENVPGSYKCRCPKGYYGDGIVGGSGCHHSSSKMNTVLTGVGVGFGSVLLLSLCFWFRKIIKKRADKKRKEKFFKRNGGFLLQQQQQQTNEGTQWTTKYFQAKELQKATDNFNDSRILGQGGQGTVYKGMLSNGQIVAIKKSKQVDEDQVGQFINEVVILSQINHRNVVKLLGCCLEDEAPLLVYEFVPNGTLFDLIHDPNTEFPVSWDMRLKIAADIAGALAYLHSACSLPIYHRDIKSSNILLDEKYVVKVSDFGTSKSVTVDQTHVTTLVKGTFGYLDPEYFQSSQFTEKSDVYSFGVVLVELLTGQRAISTNKVEEERSLAMRFLILMERDCLDEILDDRVSGQERKKEVTAVAGLAQRCLNLQGRMRPTMKEVAMELGSLRRSQMLAASSADNGSQEAKFEESKMMMISDLEYSWTTSGKSVDSSSSDSHPLMFETM